MVRADRKMVLKTNNFQSDDLHSGRPLVSIVTPFYNTADYLEECIHSVLSQSYNNWEYILVDNCSNDGSENIAKHYASLDDRIHLIKETEFVSQVDNYNRALRYISTNSKYCKIVQADDWIYSRCIEEMVAVAESGTNVGLVSSFSLYDDYPGHGGLSIARGPVYNGREAASAQLLGKALFGSPTCVMYSSDIVRSRKNFFATTSMHYEDAEACFKILKDHDFGFVPQVLTFNRRDNDSLWTRIEKYGPRILHKVVFLHRFGPDFLENKELAFRLKDAERHYYRFLAKGALQRFKSDFWDFHTEGLATADQKLSYTRVVIHVIYLLAGALINPKQVINAIWRLAKNKKS